MALTSHNMMSQQPSTISKAIANASKQNWDNTDLKEIQDICGHILSDIDVKLDIVRNRWCTQNQIIKVY